MIKKGIIVLILIITFFSGCKTVENDIYDLTPDNEPEEYQKEEFPNWLHELRRAEIIFAGSVPFAILFTNIGYSLYGAFSDDFGEGYSIENFTSSSSMTTEQRYRILSISLGLSGTIAAADFIIGLFKDDSTDESD